MDGVYAQPPLPVIPGLEGSGQIAHVGPEVPADLVGKRVAVWCFGGAWSEYITTSYDNCVPVPDDIPL